MAIDPEKLVEITKKSQVEWYKNEIPITDEEKRRYKCANPEGPVSNINCPEDDPYCNCPAKELIPKDAFVIYKEDPKIVGFQGENLTEDDSLGGIDFNPENSIFNEDDESKYAVVNSDGELLEKFETYDEVLEFIDGLDPSSEPSENELQELLEESKYCPLIEEVLGEDYLGCEWDDPDGSISCNCPEIGEKYKDWKKYTQTYCTFWNTPKQTPLLRNAQMTLLTAQKAEAVVHGDISLRPGTIINVEVTDQTGEDKSSSGNWMVAEIEHLFLGSNSHSMKLTLIRDSLYFDPN